MRPGRSIAALVGGLSLLLVSPYLLLGPRTRPKNGIPKGEAIRRWAWEAEPPNVPSPLQPAVSRAIPASILPLRKREAARNAAR